MDPLGCRHGDTGGYPHEGQRQILDIRWWAHVSSAEVHQRSDLSSIGDILRHRHLPNNVPL